MQLCLPTTRLVLAVTVVFSGGTVAAASTSEKKTDTAAARIASVKAQPSAVFLRGVAAATAIHGPPPPRQLEEERTCTSVTDTICAEDEMQVFCEILTKMITTTPEFVTYLDNHYLTIFVPTDTAFHEAAATLASLTEEDVTRIVAFHFHEGATLSFDHLVCTEKLTMLSDAGTDQSRTKCDRETGHKYQTGNGNTKSGTPVPQLIGGTDAQLTTCTATIHPIDQVMYPVFLHTMNDVEVGDDDDDDDDDDADLSKSEYESFAIDDSKIGDDVDDGDTAPNSTTDLSKSNSEGATTAAVARINCPGKASGPPTNGKSCAAAQPTWTNAQASWSGQCTNLAWNIDQEFTTTTKSVCDCSTASGLVWACDVVTSSVPIVTTSSTTEYAEGGGNWCPDAPPANDTTVCRLPASSTSGTCAWSTKTWYAGPNGMGGNGGWEVQNTDCACRTTETPSFFACTRTAIMK